MNKKKVRVKGKHGETEWSTQKHSEDFRETLFRSVSFIKISTRYLDFT